MRKSFAISACLAVLLVTQGGWAQSVSSEMSPLRISEDPLKCLVAPAREQLKYRPEVDPTQSGSTVRVRLTFSAPEQEPEVAVFWDGGIDEVRDEVIRYVKRYRLPCLRPDQAPLVAIQEFVYSPRDTRRALWWPPRREDDERPSALARCLTWNRDQLSYPKSHLRRQTEGIVLLRFTFWSPSKPPRTEVLYNGGHDDFANSAREFVETLRVPCLTPADGEITMTTTFHFILEGDVPRRRLKDVTLAQLVPALDLESQRVRFDFTTMGCPFTVRLNPRQPYAENNVAEIDRRDPNRREFIEWLQTVRLRLPKERIAEVLDDSMAISVPCGVLDLM